MIFLDQDPHRACRGQRPHKWTDDTDPPDRIGNAPAPPASGGVKYLRCVNCGAGAMGISCSLATRLGLPPQKSVIPGVAGVLIYKKK
jgi:hypothetical protein